MKKTANKVDYSINPIDFAPAVCASAASLVVLAVLLFGYGQRDVLKTVETFAVPLIALIIPIINRVFKVRVPFALNVAVTAFAFVAVDLATVLDFYDIIPYFDKMLHTAFGIVCAFGACVFFMYGNGDKMKPWFFFISVMLFVLGVAAAWEIYEYVMSAVLNSDMQKWLPDFGAVGDMTVSEFFKSYDPLWDTMWDIIVAAFGVFIFYAGVIVDKLTGYKVMKSVYRQVKGDNVADGLPENDKEKAVNA